MTRVAVSGAAGRMGRLVCAAVDATDDLELAVRYDVASADESVAGMPLAGMPVTDDLEAVADCDVVVEFTHPDVVLDNLARWHGFGLHAVVGLSLIHISEPTRPY